MWRFWTLSYLGFHLERTTCLRGNFAQYDFKESPPFKKYAMKLCIIQVPSSLALDSWEQKFCQTLGNMPNHSHFFVLLFRFYYLFLLFIFQRGNLNHLIVCFTQCTLFFFFKKVVFFCRFVCRALCNEDKCCVVTRLAADIRVAWLVYVRMYCVPIATLNQNNEWMN